MQCTRLVGILVSLSSVSMALPTADMSTGSVFFRDHWAERTPALGGLRFAPSRPPVRLHYCDTVQPHFWSRDRHEKKAGITLSAGAGGG